MQRTSSKVATYACEMLSQRKKCPRHQMICLYDVVSSHNLPSRPNFKPSHSEGWLAPPFWGQKTDPEIAESERCHLVRL